MRSLFFSDTGGQGCAAENNGVPVLCGLGGGSGTGGHFPGAVAFLARATETSLPKCLVGHHFFARFSAILVNVGGVMSARARPRALRPRGLAHKRARTLPLILPSYMMAELRAEFCDPCGQGPSGPPLLP